MTTSPPTPADPRAALRRGVYLLLVALAVGDITGRLWAVNSVDGVRLEKRLNDDGSRDAGAARAADLAARHPGTVRLVELRGNFGKSAALAAGFERATGGVVFTHRSVQPPSSASKPTVRRIR